MRPRFLEPQLHEEPAFIQKCGACKIDIYEGEHAHGLDGKIYHDDCWIDKTHEYVDNQQVTGLEEAHRRSEVCDYCGHGFDEDDTVHKDWDGNTCCNECLFEEAYNDSEFTLD